MPQRDARAVDVDFRVHLLVGKPRKTRIRQALNGKGLLDFDQVHVVDGLADLRQRLVDGRRNGRVGERRIGGRDRAGTVGGKRLEAQFLCLLLGREDHDGRSVVFRRGVARRADAVLVNGFEFGQLFQRGFAAGSLVGFEMNLLSAFIPAHGHRRDLIGEFARVLSRHGALVGSERPAVRFFAGDAFFFGRGFRPGHHRAQFAVAPDGLAHHAAPLNPVVKRNAPHGQRSVAARHEAVFFMVLAAQSPPDVSGNVEFALAHGFHAAGDDDVGVAGLNLQSAVINAFQTGTAAPVDHAAGDVVRPVGVQDGHAGAVGALAVLIGRCHDDVIHLGRFDACFLNCRLQDDTGQTIDRHVLERSAVRADRRPRAADKHDVFHLYGSPCAVL